MNTFRDQLDQDLLDNHFNVTEFGEDSEGSGEVVGLTYRPASGAPESVIQGLFDASFANGSTEATVDVNDHRPHLTCRQVDIEGERLHSDDRFVIQGKEYKPTEDQSNEMGVIRAFMFEVPA